MLLFHTFLCAAAGAAGIASAPHQHHTTPSASVVTVAARPLGDTLARYQRFDADTPLIDWRRANDTVRERGGWQAYARESAQEIARENAKQNGEKK